MFSTLGPDSLKELRAAHAEIESERILGGAANAAARDATPAAGRTRPSRTGDKYSWERRV